MTITNIISAIGNNNSVYPLLVRDCGIEVPTKVALTYQQNKSDPKVAMLATRERIVDEYTTSAVWLGGIPLLEKISNKVIKGKGFNPNISTKLLNETKEQGLELNIKKFKKIAPKQVKELEFLKANKSKYMKCLGGKVLAETAIPIALMGFVIPKAIFAWTAKTKKDIEAAKNNSNTKFLATKVKNIDEFVSFTSKAQKSSKPKTPIFKGNLISNMAEMSTVQKMATTDGGYAVGRVITARNKDAAIDISFKMAGMMFLNFMFPKMLANFLDKTTGKLAQTNLNLDIKMLGDKKFIEEIKGNKLDLPKAKTKKELLDYIDSNPRSTFAKYAAKYKKVDMLDNGVRNPLAYVDLKALKNFREDIAEISSSAIKSGNVESFMKKAKALKAANILANVGISSFLLAYALPKAQFAFRKAVLKQELEPGIAN